MIVVANYMVLVESGGEPSDKESGIAKHLQAEGTAGGIFQKLAGKKEDH
jgi:hypothetical protein